MSDRPSFELEDLLGQVRSGRVEPSEALINRIVADAVRVQPKHSVVAKAYELSARREIETASLPQLLFRLLGGWPAIGGLAGCLLIGLTLGVTQPGGLRSLASLTGGPTLRISVGIDESPLSPFGG